MRILACVLVVPMLVVVWQWWLDTSTERRLTPVASAIAGRDVHVDCQTYWGALIDPLPRHGEVIFDRNGIPEDRLFLTHETCRKLASFAGSEDHSELACLPETRWSPETGGPFADPCYATASDTIYAVLTLAHEAYHTAGVRNEAHANCFATQAMAFAATSLGAPDEEGRALATAMALLLPFQTDAYRTTDCVSGSSLDLNPETPSFPTEDLISAPSGKGGIPGLAAGAAVPA